MLLGSFQIVIKREREKKGVVLQNKDFIAFLPLPLHRYIYIYILHEPICGRNHFQLVPYWLTIYNKEYNPIIRKLTKGQLGKVLELLISITE